MGGLAILRGMLSRSMSSIKQTRLATCLRMASLQHTQDVATPETTIGSELLHFVICSALQRSAVAFGETLPVPEIVVIGGQVRA